MRTDLLLDTASVPYFDCYTGVWLIESGFGMNLFQLAQSIDLQAHLNSDRATEARKPRTYRQDVQDVAVIELMGTLQKQVSSFTDGTSTVLARKDIRSAASDPSIKSILLSIESPGGTFSGTSELADDISQAATKKPVYAHVTDLCASAAYWLASAATEISANEASLVGSIGTYMVVSDYSGKASQTGVKVHVVKAGQFKGMAEPGTALSTEQLAEIQRHVDSRNQFFLDAIAKNRRKTMKQTQELADGRIHSAKEAVSLGLIDRVSTFEDALQRAMGGSVSKPKTNGATKVTTSPVTFESEVGKHVASGKTVMQARSIVAKTQPALHQEYLERVNSRPEQQTAPTEKSAYWAKVAEIRRTGKTRAEAMREVNKQFPALCETA